eukprot:9273191-Prorocentrum_lima.AAC.1
MTSSLVGSEDVYKRQALISSDRTYIQEFLRAVEEVGLRYGLQLNETKCCLLYTSDAADDM